jgi:hypothetical protein
MFMLANWLALRIQPFVLSPALLSIGHVGITSKIFGLSQRANAGLRVKERSQSDLCGCQMGWDSTQMNGSAQAGVVQSKWVPVSAKRHVERAVGDGRARVRRGTHGRRHAVLPLAPALVVAAHAAHRLRICLDAVERRPAKGVRAHWEVRVWHLHLHLPFGPHHAHDGGGGQVCDVREGGAHVLRVVDLVCVRGAVCGAGVESAWMRSAAGSRAIWALLFGLEEEGDAVEGGAQAERKGVELVENTVGKCHKGRPGTRGT